MWKKLKQLLGLELSDDAVKSFEEEVCELDGAELRKLGTTSIPVDKIVGSVGRAHELDTQFRYRDRANTGRYHAVENAMQQGKPMQPIKVLKVKRARERSEYYVVDGHHRVATAKEHGFEDINAQVTEVILPQDTDETTRL